MTCFATLTLRLANRPTFGFFRGPLLTKTASTSSVLRWASILFLSGVDFYNATHLHGDTTPTDGTSPLDFALNPLSLVAGHHLWSHYPTSIAESLFSGVQQRLLALFFGQPDRSFYNNELLRLTGTGKGALQRELERLQSAGVVTAKRIGNQTHYQANRAAPIFEEIRGIVIKTFGLADVLRAALADLAERIELAYVFGSVAKGTDTAASDIDVMAPAEATLGRMVTPTLYTPEEMARRQREDNHFITRVLDQPNICLVGAI